MVKPIHLWYLRQRVTVTPTKDKPRRNPEGQSIQTQNQMVSAHSHGGSPAGGPRRGWFRGACGTWKANMGLRDMVLSNFESLVLQKLAFILFTNGF